MKKILFFVLVIGMIFTLSACGVDKDANLTGSTIDNNQNEITRALSEGYETVMTSVENNIFKAILQKDGSFEGVLLAVGEMTDEQYEEYNNIDWDDEKAGEKKAAIYAKMTNVKSKDVSDLVPSQDELDGYIGKSLEELEDLGFENTGYIGGDENSRLFYDGPLYCITAEVDLLNFEEKSYDDFSKEDLEKIIIKSTEFTNFSFGVLDNYQDYIGE